jgi:DNA-binding CsgD family transcriptional regulator
VDTLVGRAAEREAVERALERGAGLVVIEGEPGIGKSRLLAHLASRATQDGCLVLEARASEFEADLPYAVFAEALGDEFAEAADRHGTHRLLRDTLAGLAGARRPVVACFDDVHWADPASLDALAALVHRPPAGRVLLAVTAREGQTPPVLAAAVGAALREDRVVPVALAPLTAEEAAQLVGDAASAVYEQSGGNPFYLEQLARSSAAGDARPTVRSGAAPPPGGAAAADFVPPAVAAALAAELAALSPEACLVLDAAAVAGDPFEPRLAAAVADVSDAAALAALDELLLRALVRPASAPGRFAFRHPVIRHAVYVAAPGGWRIGAHARAAAALERRRAGPVARAHHVEQAATPGDQDAIRLLTAAAEGLQSPAPTTAARFFAAALRLLPEDSGERIGLMARQADAQAAGGDARGARDTLLAALQMADAEMRLALTVALTNQEWWLGSHEDARRRLHVELRDLPAEPSGDRVRLRLALGLMALLACDLADARAHWSDARDDARALDDPVFEAAALAGGAVAGVLELGADAADRLDESRAALSRLTEPQLATRLPAFWMHGRAQRALGRFDAALEELERGRAMAERTGRERVLLVLVVEAVGPLIELGRIREAIAAAEEGLELARLAGNPRMLLWAHSALSSARLAAGDVAGALREAEEAGRLGITADVHAAGNPQWCLGAALLAAGNPEPAAAALREALEEVLPADRPAAAADLVEALLACGDPAGAADAAEAATAAAAPLCGAGGAARCRAGGLAPRGVDRAAASPAVVGVAWSAVLLAQGRAPEAVEAATEALGAAPFTAARARLAEGRALAAAGDRRAAVEALTAAESALDGFGAIRRRDEAVRELRRLGHRVLRPAREPAHGPLTARELEIAELVAAGRTNKEIAEQLVLSPRTIEAHLRNIYGKLGVRSRVELARTAG